MRLALPALLAAALAAACAPKGDGEGPALPLTTPPPMGAGIDSFPRLAPPLGPFPARINAILGVADERVRAEITDCRTADDGQPEPNSSWERTVRIKMAGPRFLSLADTHNSFCGGAYPNATPLFATFDLDTGETIDWATYLPADLAAGARQTTDLNGLPSPRLTAPALIAWYRKAALEQLDADMRADCAEAYAREDLSVMLWLDARREGLGVLTDSFPHVIQACAQEAIMPLAELKARGADRRLTDALEAAHAAGVWAAE
jgi:hypothetical protein